MADIPEYIPVSERKKPKAEKPDPPRKPMRGEPRIPLKRRVRVLSGRQKRLAEMKLAKEAGTHPKKKKKGGKI